MIMMIAEFIPLALEGLKYVGENVLAGINNRRARLYNSPAEQVKRLQQAGLPQAAGSHITGGVQTPTEVKPGPGVQDTIAKSVSTQQGRISKQILQEQLREARVKADIAEGERNNKLNPAGTYENTNMGISMQQEYQNQVLRNQGQSIINSFMPKEKGLGLYKMGVDINKTLAETRNTLKQYDILVSDAAIKNILAEYQERMSRQELTNIIRRNTGLKWDNKIKQVEWNIAYQTQLAKMTMARNIALQSGESLKAAQINTMLAGMQGEQAKAYFAAKSRMDANWNDGNLLNNIYNIQDMIYMGFFNEKGQMSLNPSNLLNFAK